MNYLDKEVIYTYIFGAFVTGHSKALLDYQELRKKQIEENYKNLNEKQKEAIEKNLSKINIPSK